MSVAQAIALARRRKIVATPVIPGRLFSLEIGVGAKLPKDYFHFLERVGYFRLPAGELYDPSLILWYGSCNFHLEGIPPRAWPVLPVGTFNAFGDGIGFRRERDGFASEVLILNHESRWDWPDGRNVLKVCASLYEFLKEFLSKEG